VQPKPVSSKASLRPRPTIDSLLIRFTLTG
jgi:hypothetical protein